MEKGVTTHKMEFITPKNKTVSALKRSSTTAFNDSPFVIPPSPLMKKLGCGTFVTVYRYKRKKLANGTAASPWAIKKAKKGHARQSIIDRLKTEGSVLRDLNHPNIVQFKKLTQTVQGDVCLSMEVFGKGLDDIILKRQEAEDDLFTSTEIMKVTWYIAKALHYLHSTKKLLHGDIKSGNILIKANFEQVKLCDFGVSIFLADDLTGPKDKNARYTGSEPWNSREIIEHNTITDKADIFAYGLVIWEMLALDVPHVALMRASDDSELNGSFISSGSTVSDDSYTIPSEYYDALGTRPPLPEFEFPADYDAVIGMFICCSNEDYTKRPSAASIVDSLSTVIDSYNIPLHDGKETNVLKTEDAKDNENHIPS